MATNNATNTSNPIAVTQGGSGRSSTTAYAVICGGTTTTSAEQSVASSGTTGQVLTSNGASALPSFQSIGPFTIITGQLTSAQVKTLHGTPQQVIAAPGAGKIILVLNAFTSLVYGGTSAFTASSAQTINLYYGTATNIQQQVSTASIGGAANAISYITSNAISGGTGANSVNFAVNWYNASATEISGNAANDNVINYTVIYQICSI